ncbi:hypothetical protein GAC27_15510 [Bacteroides thetaiotaomicron]|nr:hypothetical protein GAC27_15510 [Bacteroides thetaiotaomicron]
MPAPFGIKENKHNIHPINILYFNRRISLFIVGKYKKEYRKARELSCKKALARKILSQCHASYQFSWTFFYLLNPLPNFFNHYSRIQ